MVGVRNGGHRTMIVCCGQTEYRAMAAAQVQQSVELGQAALGEGRLRPAAKIRIGAMPSRPSR
jgi:hypothetical protein